MAQAIAEARGHLKTLAHVCPRIHAPQSPQTCTDRVGPVAQNLEMEIQSFAHFGRNDVKQWGVSLSSVCVFTVGRACVRAC